MPECIYHGAHIELFLLQINFLTSLLESIVGNSFEFYLVEVIKTCLQVSDCSVAKNNEEFVELY